MPEDRQPADRLKRESRRLAKRQSGVLDLAHALTSELEHGAAGLRACKMCQETLPEYIEAELNGQQVRRVYSETARHLDLCSTCGQIYLDLVETARQAEAEPLPLPTPLPALDLDFLLPLSQRARQVLEPLVKEILRRLDPHSVADLPAASRDFFQRLDEMGTDVQIWLSPGQALAFGAELPPALQSLVAAFAALVAVARSASLQELRAELSGAREPKMLSKHARSAARKTGMERKEIDRWVELYVTQAQVQQDDYLALARQVAERGG